MVIEIEKGVSVYHSVKQQIASLKEQNATVKFDYRSTDGNKQARSYVAQLRKLKADADRIRKEVKDPHLQACKQIDAAGNEIRDEIESMIKFHQDPLDAIKAEEDKRASDIERAIKTISNTKFQLPLQSEKIEECIETLKNTKINPETFGDRQLEAYNQREEAIAAAEQALSRAKSAEANQAILDGLKSEEEEKNRAAREQTLIEEGKRLAQKDAENKKAAEERDAERRAENKRIVNAVHRKIAAALVSNSDIISEEIAENVIEMVAGGKIPGMKIEY